MTVIGLSERNELSVTVRNKGNATVRLEDGTIHFVELHGYEAHGIGRKKLKIKAYLD